MTEPLFSKGVMFRDRDNPLDWALEVYVGEKANYIGFITHENGRVVRPFPVIGKCEARRLVRLLQEALNA